MAKPTDRTLKLNVLIGMIGALLLASGDWLMIFGDPATSSHYFWLSEGAKHIAPWRHTLALALGIPGVIFCAIALLTLEIALKAGKERLYWRYMTSYSLLPWLTVHTFIIVQIYTFGWMNQNGFTAAALPTAEAVTKQFSWMTTICFLLISIPFILWLVFGLKGRLRLARWMAFVNPLIFLPILVLLRNIIPASAIKPAYINGEISTSFFLFFFGIFLYLLKNPGVEPGKQ